METAIFIVIALVVLGVIGVDWRPNAALPHIDVDVLTGCRACVFRIILRNAAKHNGGAARLGLNSNHANSETAALAVAIRFLQR